MKCKRNLCGLLSLWLLASCLLPVQASQESPEVVRLPYGYNDFLDLDAKGSPTGYLAEYFERLAGINGWTYEYVQADWNTAQDMLESGEIDILYPASPGQKDADLAQVPLGYTAPGIFALAGSDYTYNDYQAMDGARIALARNTDNEAQLQELARKHGFTYTPVYYETNAKMQEALHAGDVDLAIFSTANSFPEGMIVSLLRAEPVYLAVKDGNTQLLSDIDEGMQEILKTDHDLASSVLSKMLTGTQPTQAAFTQEERALLESGRVVKIGFYQDTEPLAYVDSSGQQAGIYVQLLTDMAKKAGMSLELVPIPRNMRWQDLVRDGTVDFYVGSARSFVENDPEFITTQSLLSYYNFLVTDTRTDFNAKDGFVVALTPSRYYWEEYLQDLLPADVKVRYYQSAHDCMEAVTTGEVDATLLNNLEFNYHSKNDRLSSLIQWNQYRFPTQVALSGKTGMDPVLLSAVNKALGQITDEQVQSVSYSYLNMPYHSYTAADMLYNARIPLIVLSIACLAALLTGLIWVVYRRRQERLVAKQQETERQQLQILAALSRDFVAVYNVDLDADTTHLMQVAEDVREKIPEVPAYSSALQEYIQERVLPEDQAKLLEWTSPQKVIDRFQTTPEFSIRYRIIEPKNNPANYEMVFIDVSQGKFPHGMVLGIRHIDQLMQEEAAQRQLLQEALDGANRAYMAKSEFFSRMSHDIRTPLNAITGLTALAMNHADQPGRVEDALGKIKGASRHLLSLINDVLDMSKIETGKLSLREENLNLLTLLSETAEIVRPDMRSRNHNFKVVVSPLTHHLVAGDSLRIQQVLLNLLGNAAKYTPDGGEITLSVEEIPLQTENASCYEFVVSDNGIGMDPAFQKHIFEPFSREEDLRTSRIQGTGLGMSITQNIVQMMNGTIQVESAPNQGSTFTVTLFLKLQPESAEDLSQFAGLHVLAADDDPDALTAIEDMLHQVSARSELARSGPEAARMVQQAEQANDPFELVILDWKMPEIDGLETAVVLEEEESRSVPVIITSAYDWKEIEEQARSNGIHTFLSKPITFQALIHAMHAALADQGRSEGENAGLEALSNEAFKGRKVLLAEDNELNREIAVEVLSMAGVSITEAQNGQEAVDLFAAAPKGTYDLILMDIQMPILNGYEASQKIRQLDADIPIVALTANAFVEDIQASRAAGMNDHLSKPISFERFFQILSKWLS